MRHYKYATILHPVTEWWVCRRVLLNMVVCTWGLQVWLFGARTYRVSSWRFKLHELLFVQAPHPKLCSIKFHPVAESGGPFKATFIFEKDT